MKELAKVYLDNNATTLVDPAVAEVMTDCLCRYMGNPSSVHHFGQEAHNQLVEARRSIAAVVGCRPSEIVFTSGGTEGLNLLIRGMAQGHVITSDLEHSAVFETVKYLEKKGLEATYLSGGLHGAVTAETVEKAIRSNTRLIILMAANNETGVKTDIHAIGRLAAEAKIPFIVDAVGLFGKELFSIPIGVTAVAFSGHKFHAPKGTGMVYIKQGTKLEPFITGGGHEMGRRPGTENLSGIVALAKAVRLLESELPEAAGQTARLRDRLEQGLQSRLRGVVVNGAGPRVVNTSNLSFEGVEGEALLMNLDLAGIAVSHGSACAAGALQPSRVLLNMGVSQSSARASVRFSLSRFTTEEEIDRSIDLVVDIVNRLRSVAAV